MSSCLPCCSTQNWTHEVYLKRAEYTDKNAIVLKKNVIYGKKEWSDKASPSQESGMAVDFGKRYIPAGRYVADRDQPDKLFVESELNGTCHRDKGFWGNYQGEIITKAVLGIVGFVAFGATVNVIINVIRIPLNAIAVCYSVGNSAVDVLNDYGVSEAFFVFMRRIVVDMTHILIEGAWSVVHVPFYALALEVALIYTVFCPYNGRQVAADIERAWHYPCTLVDDLRNRPFSNFSEFLDGLNNRVFFLFFCFQPRGSFVDEKDQYGSPRYVRLKAVKAYTMREK